METEEAEMERNSLEFKITEKVPSTTEKEEEKSLTQDHIVTISAAETDDKDGNKNIITILPEGSELLDGETGNLINIDHINDVGELDEDGLLHVKQELCEVQTSANIPNVDKAIKPNACLTFIDRTRSCIQLYQL